MKSSTRTRACRRSGVSDRRSASQACHTHLPLRVRHWDRAEITEGDVALDFLGYTLSIDQIYDDVTLPPMSVGEEDERDNAEEDETTSTDVVVAPRCC